MNHGGASEFLRKRCPMPSSGQGGSARGPQRSCRTRAENVGHGFCALCLCKPGSRPGRPTTRGLNPSDPAASARAQQTPAAQGAASLPAAPLPARPLNREGRGVGGVGQARAVLGLVGLVGLAARALPPPPRGPITEGETEAG